MKKKLNQQRVVDVVKYIINNKASMVTTGKIFNLSKATIFNYCNNRIKEIDYELYLQVREVLKGNAEDKLNRAVQYKKRSIDNAVKDMIEKKFKELGIDYE